MKRAKTAWGLFEDITASTFFSAGIALIFYGVMMRYVFNEPKAWVEEVSAYCIVWGAMLGFSIALRDNHHIQVDMLYDKMPDGIKKLMNVFSNLCGVIFCIVYTYYGFILVIRRSTSGMVSLDVGIPMWIVYLILPISGIMFLARFIERLVYVIQGKGDESRDAHIV